MGYRPAEIEKVIDELWSEFSEEESDVESWIKEALIKLGGGI